MAQKYPTAVLIFLFGCLRVAHSKECYSCEGINCLRTSKVNNKAECIDGLDSCVTVFEGSTAIARGCFSALPEEYRSKCGQMSDSECHKCNKNLCNNKGAIACLQCDSEHNTDCYRGVSKIGSTRCPVSTSPNSYCYTRNTSNKVERGCLIDTEEQLKCLGDSSCEMCIADGEGTCNGDPVSAVESDSARIATYGPLLLLTLSLILALL